MIIGGIVLLFAVASVFLGSNVKSQPPFPPKVTNQKITYTDAPQHIGENITVQGTIVKVYSSNGTTFLDYCNNYKTCPFSAVISPVT